MVFTYQVLFKCPLGRMTGYTVAGPQGETYPVTITEWLNRKSIIHYNDQGDVIKQIDAVGNTVEYFYNEAGRGNMNRKKETIVANERDPISGQPKTEVYETKFLYNAFNKIEKIIDPQGGETLFIYDGMGNLNFSIDAEGNQIEHTYDKFGRRTSTSRYLEGYDTITTIFTYYADGKLMRIEDARGHITNYEYDFQKNRRGKQRPPFDYSRVMGSVNLQIPVVGIVSVMPWTRYRTYIAIS